MTPSYQAGHIAHPFACRARSTIAAAKCDKYQAETLGEEASSLPVHKKQR